MRAISISPRLLALAGQVRPGARFADVGTDHARLPVWLLEQGVIDRAIATDLRVGPLERARQTAGRHGVTGQISFRLGDGLSPVKPHEVDTVAIAGMGGETIAAILAAAPWTAEGERKLLLQPMTSASDLRRWLAGHGYVIETEALIREGESLYVTMSVSPGTMPPLSPGEIWAGRQYRGMVSAERGAYLAILAERARKAGEGLLRSNKPADELRRDELERTAADLTRMREEWDAWQR